VHQTELPLRIRPGDLDPQDDRLLGRRDRGGAAAEGWSCAAMLRGCCAASGEEPAQHQ